MEFVEVPAFTSRVLRYLGEDRYADLQSHLSRHPTAGAIIPGGKGLRKVRWAASGRGKRGGVRVIYYWHVAPEIITFPRHLSEERKRQPDPRRNPPP